MQKNACRSFIDHMTGWTLAGEYTECGVSGYHKSESQRDVLQQLKAEAQGGGFDVLLVFMFDRLGRREDETPFVVEWFAAQGVEVWSVCEGLQRFDSRVDRLLNYIRFWQSGGESEKTSLRVAEKHKQMVLSGQYRGGAPPYGYRLTPSGRQSGKGRRLLRLEPDEKETCVVSLIYRLAADYGYGGTRIARLLNEQGTPTKNGLRWTPPGVLSLLKNPIYKGCYVSGRRKNSRGVKKRMAASQWIQAREIDDALAIVSEDVWNRAEDIRLSRRLRDGRVPMQTRSPLLLSGILQCGTCGQSMSTRHGIKRWRTKDGAEKRSVRLQYVCRNRGGKQPCGGQRAFSREKADPLALDAVRAFIATLPTLDVSGQLAVRHSEIASRQEKISLSALKRRDALSRELLLLRDEITRSVSGESPFAAEQLAQLIDTKKAEIAQCEQTSATAPAHPPFRDHIPDWQHEFDSAPQEVQRMLMASLIEKATISRDEIHFFFTVDFLHYPY